MRANARALARFISAALRSSALGRLNYFAICGCETGECRVAASEVILIGVGFFSEYIY